jgi:UDP-glucose 4-epimerase
MQVPINPYGKAKKMAEEIILDFSKGKNLAVMILRFVLNDTFTSTGSDMGYADSDKAYMQ